MATSSKFQNLVEELKRRRVFRVATLYVVAMWPIIQIADILSPALDLPDNAMRSLLMVFIVGFPIAIVLAWLFNLTPKGLVKTGDNVNPEAEQRMISKHAEVLIVIGLLIVAISLFLFQSGSSISSQQEPSNLSAVLDSRQIESIAVLPFVPFSENKQDEYFADGLSEELLNVLAKIKTLRVAARTSSFAYKGVSRNIQKVGRELGVDVILEGSVRRNDVNNTIRVTAQLIDIASGSHLWSETYDRQFNDIFKIQDEITAAVVSELKITLLGEEQKQLLAHETATPEAMVAHSMGRSELAKRTGPAIIQASKYFEQAVSSDPWYATAYASLAESYILSIDYADMPKEEYKKKAQQAVNKALELDSNLGLAWAAQGLIYFSSEDKIKEANEALEKAIELNPSYAMAYMWYGSLQKDLDKRTKYHQKAFQLDPKSPVAGYNVASNMLELGQEKEAMEVFSKIVEADPFYPGAYMLVGEISRSSGRLDQAILQFKKSYELGEARKSAFQIANLYTDLGDKNNARTWIDIAAKDAPEYYKTQLKWLEIASLLIDDKRDEAYAMLTDLKKVGKPSLKGYLQSTIANYLLEDFPETIRLYEKAMELNKDSGKKHMAHDILDVHVYAAYAYQQLEMIEQSQKLIDLVNSEQDKIKESGKQISSYAWYRKSLVQMIEGEQKMSLITLQRAIDEGWSQVFRIREEPILKNLKIDPNYQAMVAGLEAKLNLMREQLAFEESFTTHWKG
ncbi:MAG: tetratricopeptide repeat protein [Gammaproteobacteria bacterium]|nr:tetratricopeptide repeat protein [Gammaproteobacteria bacterium]